MAQAAWRLEQKSVAAPDTVLVQDTFFVEGEWVPACKEVCPHGAIHFGDLNDPASEVAHLASSSRAFRLLEHLGTDPGTVYLSSREWVREIDREETFLTSVAVNHDVS